MDFAQILAIVIFVVAFALIMTEKVHRTVVAICGAALLLICHVMTFDQAMSHVDFNTLGVLFGMMLFVAITKQSGLFEYLSIKTAKIAKGDPWRIMLLFVILTAVTSAILDNVTTVLLMGPMTITICRLLKTNPVPFFMVEIMASNVGGTATLIGDPPNILIGSAAGLSFTDFVAVDTPAAILILIALLIVFYFMYGRKFDVAKEDCSHILELDEKAQIHDKTLLIQALCVLALIVLGFILHSTLGIESCVVALAGAGLLLLISGQNVEKALHNVEWVTLAFFAGLFIIVGGLVETGTIDMLANALVEVTGGDVFITMLVLLVASALISSFLDNIPFVATMIPIIIAMQGAGMDVTPLWWAVSLGACLGGNGTIIGASANVVLSDISAKNGHPISFMEYLKVGFPIMLMTIAIAAVYLIVRFPA